MPKTMITYMNKDEDTGTVWEFGFMVDGKKYKVTPKKPSDYSKMDEFYRFIRKAERTGINPFVFRAKEPFNIERENPAAPRKPGPKPDAEQQDLFGKAATALDKVANTLEAMHLFAPARIIDEISNRLDSSKWCGVDSMGFWDEIANMDIGYDRAKKVLDAFDAGADTEHSCAKVSKVDAWTCRQILDLADDMGLIPVINDGNYKEWLDKFGPENAKKRIKEVYEKLQKKARTQA